MNDLTKALLKDLQHDIDKIKCLESNIEVVWQLENLKKQIDLTTKLIKENLVK